MGTDIGGWVEARRGETWSAEFRVSPILPRSYDLFGCLFGVRNHAHFDPLFANRGLPADVSQTVRKELEEDFDHYDKTWASYEELVAIDHHEASAVPDDRIHELQVLPDGSERLLVKALWSANAAPYYAEVEEKGEVRVGDRIYRKGFLTRGDALNNSGFQELLQKMGELADELDPSNVRVVVGFD